MTWIRNRGLSLGPCYIHNKEIESFTGILVVLIVSCAESISGGTYVYLHFYFSTPSWHIYMEYFYDGGQDLLSCLCNNMTDDASAAMVVRGFFWINEVPPFSYDIYIRSVWVNLCGVGHY